jgi:hypothetical protein
MAKNGDNHKGGAPTMVERIGVAQLIRSALANHWQLGDPEQKLIQQLADIATSEQEPSNNKIAAIKLLAGYLWGNPKTMIEADFGKSAPTIIFKQANE